MKLRMLVLAIALTPGIFLAGAQTGSADEPFPLTEGTYWVYQGLVRYFDKASPENGAEAKVNWRMEIVRILHRKDSTAAIVKGLPSDLNWSTGSVAPRDSLLVRTNDGRFYLIDPDRAAAAEQKFKDPQIALQDFLEDDDLWFQLPLAQGKKFCSPDQANRDDSMYCWVAEGPSQVSLDGIKGLPAKMATAYTLAYRTNPDDSEVELAPGIGIIHYEYHHHGTIADTELKLVEFHAGS